MKHLILEIADEKYQDILDFLNKIPQVTIIKNSLEEKLSTSQQKTWQNIKGAFEELKLIEKGIKKARPASEFLKELKKNSITIFMG